MSLSKKKCCVPGCMDLGGMQFPLHSFPNPATDKQRFNDWIMKIGGNIIGLGDDDIYKHRSVCHAHFEEKYCCRNQRLCNIAVPTLNLPGLLSLPKFTYEERRPLQENIKQSSSTAPRRLFYSEERKPFQELQNVNLPSTSKDPAIQIPSCVPETDLVTDTHPSAIHLEESCRGKNSTLEGNTPSNSCVAVVAKKFKTLTPLEKKLYTQLVQAKAKLSKYRCKVRKQSACLKTAKKLTTNPAFIETLEKLPSSARILTMLQFREIKKEDKGRRFTLEEKILALSILKQSPKCYRFLRKILILPAPQTLTKLLAMANIQPGINETVFAQIKKATQKLKQEDRLCILLFDEMALTANITYNERKDRVGGFVTDGDNISRPEYADHAQVFMVRGLMRNYKQPVSYTFSSAATKGSELAKQLKAVIKNLQEAGLIVVATVCDQGTNNRNAIKLLTQETRGTFIKNGLQPKENVFIVNNQEIVPLYDPPHLMKCIRNNLLTKNLTYSINSPADQQHNIRTAKWEHIELLHKENPGYQGIRLIPKLTDNHVLANKISKMKVKYATQVFSRTVASNMGYLADKGIIPQECQQTADLLLFFDELFDSLNGSFKAKKGKTLLGPARPTSDHHKIWAKAKIMLKSMKFQNKTNGKQERVPTLDNWVWTLDGIQILLTKLHKDFNVSSVWMRHLNQDPLENFFGAIRSHGCRNTNPSTEKFEGAYASLLVNNLSSVHAPGANCEKDFCKTLSNLLITKNVANTTSNIDLLPEIIIKDISEKNDPRILGPLTYVSGYFIHHTSKKIYKTCAVCKNDLHSQNENEYLSYREYAGRNWLKTPSESFLSCMSAVQDINNAVIKKNIHSNNLKETIKTIICCYEIDKFDFISCPAHREKIIDHLLNLSSRFYIYNYCKDINNILKGRKDVNDDEDVFQLKAKKHFHKCWKRKK